MYTPPAHLERIEWNGILLNNIIHFDIYLYISGVVILIIPC